MAATGYANQHVPTQGIEATRERSVEDVLSEACNAAAGALQLIEGMESNPAPAQGVSPVPAGIIASGLYLHEALGTLHQRLIRLSERLGKI